MCKKLCLVLSLVLVLSFAGAASAAIVTWDGSEGNGLWSDGLNWDTGSSPGSADSAFHALHGDTVNVDINAVVGELRVGNEAEGAPTGQVIMNVAGTTLGVTGNATLGHGGGTIPVGREGVLNVSSGGVTVLGNMFVGNFGSGILNMTGGTVDVGGTTGFFVLQETSSGFGGTGHVQLDGGLLDVNTFVLKTGGSMDITNGTFIFQSVAFSIGADINALIAAGHVTAFGGAGTVVVTPLANTKTMLTAIPEPATMLLLGLGGLGMLRRKRNS